MSQRSKFQILALAGILGGLAGGGGCASSSPDWDRPYGGPEEPPEQDIGLNFQMRMNEVWEEAYGLAPGELMGPFWNEPAGPPEDKMVFLGPYFEEPEARPIPFRSLKLRLSRSRLYGDNPPGLARAILMACLGRKKTALATFGLYYAEGRNFGDQSIPEGMGPITEFGFEMGFRGYLTSGESRVGLYCSVEILLGGMTWSYAPPSDYLGQDVLTQATEGTVTSGTLYFGLGATLVKVGPLYLGLNAGLGARSLDLKYEGELANRLFDDSMMEFSMEIEISCPF